MKIFAVKTLTNFTETAKFAKVFTCERFLLYGNNAYFSGLEVEKMIGLVDEEDLHPSVGHVVATRVYFSQLAVRNLDVGGESCTPKRGA